LQCYQQEDRLGGALSNFVVLDASESVAGQYCCRMFADFGADVTLIEPPGGSALRRCAPFDPAHDGAGSLLFFHLNLGKRSTVLDPTTPAGRDRLCELARDADVIVVGTDRDANRLQQANPQCVVAVVSDFDPGSPYGDWIGCEMVFQALSSMMYNNGESGREPLYGCGHRASYAAGVGLYIGVLAALYARPRIGAGQEVRLEVALNTAAMSPPNPLMYLYSGLMEPRGERSAPFTMLHCRDGWLGVWVYQHLYEPMCKGLDRPDLLGDARFADPAKRKENFAQLVRVLEDEARKRSCEELLACFHKARLVAAIVHTPRQLRESPHLAARGFWESVPTTGGERLVLGPQYRFSATPRRLRGGAPDIGEPDHVPASPDRRRQPLAAPAVRRAAGAHNTGPLSGLRVLEFTTAWAGPMAGRILAFLGAEVIKVESAARPDIWRYHATVHEPRRFPDRVAGARRYNRSGNFNSQNMNKLSVALDVKHPGGRRAVRALAKASDVIICNFTAGTLARMGLAYEALRQDDPAIIVLEMPGFGNSGPLASRIANGATMEIAAGMSAFVGYPDGAPTTTGQVYPDPMGGYNGAAAVLTALLHRQFSGEGQYIEVPQVESSMQFIGEELLHHIAAGTDPAPHGNRVRWAAPHDAYRAAGEDQWVTLAIANDDEWQRFCALIGDPGLATDARFASFEARWTNQDGLREPIEAWTRTRDKFYAAARLQRERIRAAPVLDPGDVTRDLHLAWHGFFTPLTQADSGTHAYPSLPFRFSRTPGSQHRASPCLGADTHYVLREIAGMSLADVEALDRAGVTSTNAVAG
jgi:crotonobetainyl-CoA:carnitine CoA-transferase CaiB-like acyl-CoA transferase